MNPAKEPSERARNGHLGVAFPPGRKPEVEAVAKAMGLTVSAWVRMLVLRELDAISFEKAKREKILQEQDAV